ncbi:MAG TPA: Gfo/Idh/MocA family oxidoreductase [Candidatus Hydrogenedentes bacterium]|nr:Gfo/Idh/MocA family oxidoreductase [Candidatus Hydrogenedentota bacterium]
MSKQTTRREFLKSTTAGAAVAMSALSYSKVAGANDRIRIGQIGCGSRGRDAHMAGVHPFDKEQNVEFTAVCDPWRVAREKAAAMAKDWYGREPKMYVSYRDMLADNEVDAVMIASPDHVHTMHLEAAAKAKKDIYCEKPLSKDLESLKSSCDACKENNVVVQIGTQLRSMNSMTGCRELYKTGVLGKVGRIEQCRNGSRPYWYAYVKEAKEEDVEWKEFLADRPMRPFDPVLFTGWYGYREFSDGPVPGFASHYLDLIHYITGAKFPASAVCMGGTFIFNDENKFTCPDHVQATWIYPEGFLVHYSTYFGSGAGCSFKMIGQNAMMDLQDWSNPFITAEGAGQPDGRVKEKTPVEHIETTNHMLNWLQCLRTRETPNASIDAGYQHAVAAIMAVKAQDTGHRQVYDPEKREIMEG